MDSFLNLICRQTKFSFYVPFTSINKPNQVQYFNSIKVNWSLYKKIQLIKVLMMVWFLSYWFLFKRNQNLIKILAIVHGSPIYTKTCVLQTYTFNREVRYTSYEMWWIFDIWSWLHNICYICLHSGNKTDIFTIYQIFRLNHAQILYLDLCKWKVRNWLNCFSFEQDCKENYNIWQPLHWLSSIIVKYN